MELIAVIIMLFGGVAIAGSVMIAAAALRQTPGQSRSAAATSRDDIAASLLYRLLVLGGDSPEGAVRRIRQVARVGGRVTDGIDMTSWGGRYAEVTDIGQREELLASAVRLLSASAQPVPLPQYCALLDLSFALGFHTDALAQLREQHPFDYVDHARDGRPREADRAGRTTLFARSTADRAELLRLLEIEGTPTRPVVIAAYRRVIARHHPDRYHQSGEEVQAEQAERFIAITRAYETLLADCSE